MTNIQEEIIDNRQLTILAMSPPTKKHNTENVFATDNIYDYLIDFNGHTAVFNYRNGVRVEILKYFKDGKKFYYSKNDSCGFSLRDISTDRKILNLSQLIIAEKYPNCRIETIKKSRVLYLDGDKLNLKDENLEYCRALVKYENKYNEFETIGDELVITHKETGTKFYTHADDHLRNILQRQRWYLQPSGYLITNYPGVKGNINLSAFIFAYYYLGMKKTNIVSCLKKIKNKKSHVIDHLDDNIRNNRKWNISMMLRTENSSKRNIVSKIGLPFICDGVYLGDEKYRLVMSHSIESVKIKSGIEVKFENNIFEFESAEQMIRYLQYWYENFFCNGISPKINYEFKKQNGEKIVRYELRQHDYEKLKNATLGVTNNLSECGKIDIKQFMQIAEASSPEAQEQIQNMLSHVKLTKGFMFLEPLPRNL